MFNKFLNLLRKRKSLKISQVTPTLPVPSSIKKPSYALPIPSPVKQMHEDDPIIINSSSDIQKLKKSCKIAANVLDYAISLVEPGITTDEIDRKTHELIIKNEAYPSPLHYSGFPKSICTSINECACHGIPDLRPLQEGDIINIDVTVFKDGFHGDTSKTVIVEKKKDEHYQTSSSNKEDIDNTNDSLEDDEKGNNQYKIKDLEIKRELLKIAEKAMYAGISICGPGVPIKDIAPKIEEVVKPTQFGILEHFVGHGIGKEFHCVPAVCHTENEVSTIMKPGMAFTIEPIITELKYSEPEMHSDGWTVLMSDRTYTAQFEHTILITNNGHEILTKSIDESNNNNNNEDNSENFELI